MLPTNDSSLHRQIAEYNSRFGINLEKLKAFERMGQRTLTDQQTMELNNSLNNIMNNLHNVAIHEAGHAVADCVLGSGDQLCENSSQLILIR